MSSRSCPPPWRAASLRRAVFDEDAAHRLGRRAEEMRAIGKVRIAIRPDEAHPGFMHERCGLQRVPVRFVRHLHRSELAQLFIDERKQLPGRGAVARAGRVEESRDVVHEREA